MTATEAAVDALAEPTVLALGPEPPGRDQTPRQWLRANLFSTPFNTVLTVLFGVLAALLLFLLGRWLVDTEWTIVRVNLRLFMVGRFPEDQLWRIWGSAYVLALTLGFGAAALVRTARLTGREGQPDRLGPRVVGVLHRFWPAALAAVVLLSFTRTVLPTLLTAGLVVTLQLGRLAGRWFARLGWQLAVWPAVIVGVVASYLVVTLGPDGVGWDDWGGLHLTLFATVSGIGLAFPFGLLLALGRRSSLPAVKVVSVVYIEAFRAVPLVTLLFVGQDMIRLLFPSWMDPPSQLVRAVVAITLFEAAYIAEIVRGGLNAVPRGQIEAAQAVGLTPTKVQRLVVLPQALRAVIPALVGQFISLFKDTSLLSIVGFFEIVSVSQTVTGQDRFLGQELGTTTLVFVAFLFWAGCSTMARESRRLERRLGVGER
jgi:general L-amino acid transport system permease protein